MCDYTQTLTSVQLTMAAVVIIRTALTTSAASLASVTQDTPKTAQTPAKVVYTLHVSSCIRLEYCCLEEQERPAVTKTRAMLFGIRVTGH